jgi:hypothetical protein
LERVFGLEVGRLFFTSEIYTHQLYIINNFLTAALALKRAMTRIFAER